MYLLLLLLIFHIPLFINAQNLHILRPDGSVKSSQEGEILPSQKAKIVEKTVMKSISHIPMNTEGLLDTIYQRDLWPQIDSRFGWQGQDVMIQWFKAPADLILKSVGFGEAPSNEPNLANQVEVKVVSVNWDQAHIVTTTTVAAKHLGYYEAPGNGYNDAEPLIDDFDGINTWNVWHVLDSTTAMTEPFGTDIWSNNGLGVPVAVDPGNASGDPDNPTYHWVDMNLLGYEPTIQTNEIFGIAIINSNATVDDYFVRTWSTDLNIPWGAFIYYANGRFNPGVDYGWWSREYAWDMAVAVDILGGGFPYINITTLNTTLSTEPRTVEASLGCFIPLDTVKLNYTIDNGMSWNMIPMDSVGIDTYKSDIPGQPPGTNVLYNVSAKNQMGNSIISTTCTYNIFGPIFNTLIAFNGFDTPTGYPQSYYFGIDDFTTYACFAFDHDYWSYGRLTEEIVNYYDNIIEITTSGPNFIDTTVIRNWLNDSNEHNYMLAGDDWLGVQTGWVNTTYSAGTFQYDILGITADYNDVNFGQSGDHLLPSPVFPIAGSLLGDSLEWKRIEVGVDQDSVMYDPNKEIGQANWLDGVDVLGDVEVDIKGIGVTGDTFNIAIHRTLPAGNKVVFLSYDPLSLNSTPSNYYWFGFSSTAPQVQVLKWFGADSLTAIETEEQLPVQFSLSQNYPNPFNPVTKIEYSIAKTAKVEIVVFDILGREVAKLVNETKKAGKHEVNFEASKYASGLYFYRLKAGDTSIPKNRDFTGSTGSPKGQAGERFIQTRKMLFLQ